MTYKGTVRDADTEGFALTADEAEAIASGAHADPFSVLGIHTCQDGFVARAFLPGADAATAMTLEMSPSAAFRGRDARDCLKAGSASISGNLCAMPQPIHAGSWTVDDPYSYTPGAWTDGRPLHR
jgi:1,4-alpha-glucan branching enzyme